MNMIQYICASPEPGRSPKLTHTGVAFNTCSVRRVVSSPVSHRPRHPSCVFRTVFMAWGERSEDPRLVHDNFPVHMRVMGVSLCQSRTSKWNHVPCLFFCFVVFCEVQYMWKKILSILLLVLLLCLVLWINYWPSVCWSTICKSSFKRWLIIYFDITEKALYID